MNQQEAEDCLAQRKNKKLSEVGEAVDVLYQIYKTYKKMATKCLVPSSKLSAYRSVFQLPKGIRWKVDEGKIEIAKAQHIARLNEEQDQWLLAFIAVERKLKVVECKRVVDLVQKENWKIKKALGDVTGVRFEEMPPPPLVLPFEVDFWFKFTQFAWERYMNFADLCYQLIREGVDMDVDNNKIAAADLDRLSKTLIGSISADFDGFKTSIGNTIGSTIAALRQTPNQPHETEKDTLNLS